MRPAGRSYFGFFLAVAACLLGLFFCPDTGFFAPVFLEAVFFDAGFLFTVFFLAFFPAFFALAATLGSSAPRTLVLRLSNSWLETRANSFPPFSTSANNPSICSRTAESVPITLSVADVVVEATVWAVSATLAVRLSKR